MDRWKFLILDMPMSGETAVLFPPHLPHAEMAQAFASAMPVAAGFVRFNEETKRFECYGKSDSLKLTPRKEPEGIDEYLVNKVLRNDL